MFSNNFLMRAVVLQICRPARSLSSHLPPNRSEKNTAKRQRHQETWLPCILEGFKKVALEKATASHSSTLGWKILWMEEPGGLQSMGSPRVGLNWATSLSLFMHWRRTWQPTPVFLLGESQGQGSLVERYLWGCTESYTTEAT